MAPLTHLGITTVSVDDIKPGSFMFLLSAIMLIYVRGFAL